MIFWLLLFGLVCLAIGVIFQALISDAWSNFWGWPKL